MTEPLPDSRAESRPRSVLDSAHVPAERAAFTPTTWTTAQVPIPRFGSEVWYVAGLDPLPRSDRLIDFTQMSPEWSLYAREVIYWRSASPVELRTHVDKTAMRLFPDQHLKAGTVSGLFRALRTISTAASELNIGLPVDWGQAEIEDLTAWAKSKSRTNGAFASVMKTLHGLGGLLTLGALPIHPFGDVPESAMLGLPAKTDQVLGSALAPDVFAALLRAAIRYVEVASEDILAAIAWRGDIERRWSASPPAALPKRLPKNHPAVAEGFNGPLRWAVECLVREYGGLPVNTASTNAAPVGAPSLATIAALLDNPQFKNNLRIKQEVRERIAAGTRAIPGMLPLSVGADRPGGPWRAQFCWTSINVERQALRDACVIVILALTGARVSEISSMKCGDWRTTWYGAPAIKARLIKTTPNGEERKWWATPLVLRACELLELTAKEGSEFLTSSTTQWKPRSNGVAESRPLPNVVIHRFVRKVNTDTSLVGFGEIPAGWEYGSDVNTAGPMITPRALRMTLAVIGNTVSLGDAALQQQLKHASYKMTYGYMKAGGHREWVEVLTERQGRDALDKSITTLAAIWAGERPLRGAGGRRIEQAAKKALALDAVPDFDPGSQEGPEEQFFAHLKDAPSLIALLRKVNVDLHFGTLNHCLFNPQTAACGRSDQPLLATCLPEGCANTVIPVEQLAIFRDTRDEISEYMATRRLPPRQKEALARRVKDLGRQIGDEDDQS